MFQNTLIPFKTYAKRSRYGYYILNYHSDKVICYFNDSNHMFFPYVWDKKLNCWNECSNKYSVKYIQKLEKLNKVRFIYQ